MALQEFFNTSTRQLILPKISFNGFRIFFSYLTQENPDHIVAFLQLSLFMRNNMASMTFYLRIKNTYYNGHTESW